MTNEEGGIDPEEFRVRGGRRSREHDRRRSGWASTHRLRPVPQPQVRSVHAEGLLPAARLLCQLGLRKPYFWRRHPVLRGPARSRDAGTGSGAQARAGGHRRARAGTEDSHAGAARRAGTVGAVAAGGRARLDPARARARDRHERRDADRAPRPLTPRVGPEPGAHVLRDHGRHHGAGNNGPASRNASRSLAAEERPGAGRVRALSRHRPPRRGRAKHPTRRTSRGHSVHDRQGGRLRLPIRGRRPVVSRTRPGEPQGWLVGDQRHAGQRARAAPCRPRRADAVRLRGRHANHSTNRSPRRHHRSGHRTPAALGDHGPGPARGQRARRAAAPDPGATSGRAQRGARRRAGRVLPRHRTVAAAHTRCADGGAQGTRRPPDSLHARHEGAALVRASVVRVARARQLHGQGRTCLRAHARRPFIRCATTCP